MPQDRATVNSEGVDEGGAGPIEVFEPLVARPYGASSERWVSRDDPRWRDERFPARNRHNQRHRICEAMRERAISTGRAVRNGAADRQEPSKASGCARGQRRGSCRHRVVVGQRLPTMAPHFLRIGLADDD